MDSGLDSGDSGCFTRLLYAVYVSKCPEKFSKVFDPTFCFKVAILITSVSLVQR